METNVAPVQDTSVSVIDKLDQLIAIAQLGAQKISLDQTLWESSDCAKYLKVSVYQFTQRISTQPGFPPASLIPSKRWIAGEVIEWATRKARSKKR